MHHILNRAADRLSPDLFDEEKQDASAIKRRKRKRVNDRQVEGKESRKLQQGRKTHRSGLARHHSNPNRTREIGRKLALGHEIPQKPAERLEYFNGERNRAHKPMPNRQMNRERDCGRLHQSDANPVPAEVRQRLGNNLCLENFFACGVFHQNSSIPMFCNVRTHGVSSGKCFLPVKRKDAAA